jgi:hypothetical protein
MRQAADILSSAPAMQIRYLEAMQAMAKSANSKVIFLPAANQTMGPGNISAALEKPGEGHGAPSVDNGSFEFGGQQDSGFQQAMNSRMMESI